MNNPVVWIVMVILLVGTGVAGVVATALKEANSIAPVEAELISRYPVDEE